jgi:hypothetical protein
LPILVLHAGKLQIRPNSARLHGKNKGPLELARFARKELSHWMVSSAFTCYLKESFTFNCKLKKKSVPLPRFSKNKQQKVTWY